jgi:short-subunit dehydrogenase
MTDTLVVLRQHNADYGFDGDYRKVSAPTVAAITGGACAALLASSARSLARGKPNGKVNQIYNNAGIAFAGDVEASQFKDIERVMDVDFWGVVNGTKVFLPHLIASGDGHVVNISSIFGLFSVPGQAAYNAAKFAVRGFTEALRQEMAVAGHPVKVTTVHPGGIKTGIVRNITTVDSIDKDELAENFDKKLANTSPQKAARIILDGVRKNRARVLVGPDAKALDLIVRATGSGYQRLFSTVMSRLVPNAH